MKKDIYSSITSEELYALVRRARLERARVVGEMIASGARALRSLFVRAFSAQGTKGVRHA